MPDGFNYENVDPLFFYVISCSFCARLRRVASSTHNIPKLERKVTGRKKDQHQVRFKKEKEKEKKISSSK